ncbi:type II toxin-antitoxin system death-on-curing family toxin [Salinibacterium soli]|uniref:Type II toxin-antitoxin system death-on-curing family toxin n=1 Tax=Antiquaquibacter soli TaxID=3064523 RepID=A0ABT9BQ48_9MICO|nr:type II toxin-antitoxin system death-on-curing family toxin [Protaetiibacter sp. WY-16]MDO7882548.1 type II toxin-antitoxin system death-on-curing family toxin [Protaetiibacter sp. WY-16]
MRRRTWTVEELARESDLDVEQVLVALWSEGVEYPVQPSHRIRSEHATIAERATGIVGGQAKRISYWTQAFGVTREQLAAILDGYGIRLPRDAQVLPKGAVRRLRAHFGAMPASSAPEATDLAPQLPTAPPFEWSAPGTARDCQHLTSEELVQVHEALAADFASTADPISPAGVKSMALLESAAARPATSYGDSRKYPTVESAAAALLHSIVHNHPFHNGNKRSALVSTMVFLDRHNLVIESNEEELFRFMIRVAAHDLLPDGYVYDQVSDREVAAIADWLIARSRQIRREERSLTWRELQKKLKQRGCDVEVMRGGKIHITREVQGRRRFLGGHKTDTLSTYFINTGDGREVPKTQLKRMRSDLHLDADHGVDAEVFYGDHKDPDFFILRYSQLLKRLARV